MSLGYRQARFAGQFGENFERNFLGPRSGMGAHMFGQTIPTGHGASGEIVSLNLPQIVVSGTDNLEKTILVNASTTIRQFRNNIKVSDLSVGDFVVALGNPNDQGMITATLIRVMPEPGSGFMMGGPRN
jgi:hypothetical protein